MSTSPQSSSDYYTECQSIAEDLAKEALANNEWDKDEAENEINDTGLHEAIDGHQWIIYYTGNEGVLRYSSNEDAWEDCYGAEGIGKLVMDKGMDGARTVQAYFAMEADVREYIDDALEDAIAEHEKELEGKEG